MKPRPNFQQASNPAPDCHGPGGRFRNSGKYLKKSAFPGTVPPDNAKHLSLIDFEINPAQCPDRI